VDTGGVTVKMLDAMACAGKSEGMTLVLLASQSGSQACQSSHLLIAFSQLAMMHRLILTMWNRNEPRRRLSLEADYIPLARGHVYE